MVKESEGEKKMCRLTFVSSYLLLARIYTPNNIGTRFTSLTFCRRTQSLAVVCFY